MRVIKNINNNVSICIDGKGNELVALGKGIGFRTPPYEITDLSIIQKTYYNISQKYFELFQMIPYEYFELSGQILEYARDRLQCPLNPNLIVTLADHIQFAVNRCRKGLHLNYSGFYGLKYSNPEEYEIGLYALRLINNTEGVELEDERNLLHRLVDRLNPRERQIMQMRFGMAGYREYTQKEVADCLGISQSYISRLEKRIIGRLKKDIERAV